MKRLIPAILLLAAACSGEPEQKTDAKPVVRARGELIGVKIVFGIDAVDRENRKVTLRGPGGKTGVYKVTPEVKRLNEIKAGDTLLAEYSVVAVAELRAPTPEEEKDPLVLAEMIDRRPGNLPPGGTIARSMRAVVGIEAVNGTAGTVTLKGPLEGEVVLKADDVSGLKAGQKIVVTFDETLVLSVEPGGK